MKLIHFLFITNFFTGALIMIVELLGTRFIAPSFGASLYIWTALITVTLIALSAGYATGGHLADKRPSPNILYGIIFASGLCLLVVLLIRNPILHGATTLGSRLGALTAATVLFGPPLFLLGMVSPFSVKLCTKKLSKLGDIVGWLYATSTFGSFVGTLSAGFLLLPHFNNITVLVFCAAALSLLASIYFFFFRKKIMPAAVTAAVIILATLVAYRSSVLPSGTEFFQGEEKQWETVYQTNSFYGRIRIIDFPEEKKRVLLNDGLTQGRYNYGTKKPAVSFPYVLTDLLLEQKKDPENALVLGLGAGFVPKLLREKFPDMEITAVEINPVMVEVADNYFDLIPHDDNSKFHIYMGDARYWVQKCSETFDYIVLDTFLGDNTPSHLLSYEMFRDLRTILADDGALAINIFGSLKSEQSKLIQAVVKTMKQGHTLDADRTEPLFEHVQLFSYEATSTAHNLYMLAYNGPEKKRKDRLLHYVASWDKEWLRIANYSLKDQTAHLDSTEDAPILTDNYNPAEFLDIAVKETLRTGLRDYWGSVLEE